ncbi:hypothetical protein GCM10025872_02370 [Barrientosiimonas endolithica]|uniref:Helicase ATP-binding domain-containing protein n=1 Tax=Barrientosiimonas endolithica TaxID=1535208 RepID=A0ABN6YKB9_9MICO|nr:hypothetical protein GCM10025872_02370 [Barrientosiimonas endolithica]
MTTTTAPPQRASADPERLLAGLTGAGTGRVVHVERQPARAQELADWPEWVNPQLAAAVRGEGVDRLWSHQRAVADLAAEGRHVVVSTGTASGKSLGYLLPVLSAVADGSHAVTGRGATALYLSPTKALAADQLAAVERLAVPGVRAATYDGDTPVDERRWIRDHAQLVLTNPDLLHHTLLPQHERWAPFLRALRYVVIDECHAYKGVFGSHLAAVLRRLRRICARYRAHPTFVLASATIAEPAAHAERLVGLPVEAVTRDGSPRPATTFALWEPGTTPATAPTRPGAAPWPRPGTCSPGWSPTGRRRWPSPAPASGSRSSPTWCAPASPRTPRTTPNGSRPTAADTSPRSGATWSAGCAAASCAGSPPPTPSSSAST